MEYRVRVEEGDTLGALLERAAGLFPKNEACVQGNVRIHYEAYLDRINRLGNGLLKLGVARDEKVAILMPSIPEWLYAHWAAVKLGAPVVPINTRFKRFEVEYLLKQSDATTLFLIDTFLKNDFVSMIYQIIPELRTCRPGELVSPNLPMLKRVIVLGQKSYEGMLDYKSVLELGEDYSENAAFRQAQQQVTPQDIYQIAYTSGTTGFPKGVIHTHSQWMRNQAVYAIRCGFSNSSRILTVSPFSMGMGSNGGFMSSGLNGGCVLPMQAFEPGEALRIIEEEKVTFFVGSPTMYIMMMNHPDFAGRNTRSIRTAIVGGADVSPLLVSEMMEKMGIEDVINAYGMTENNYNTTFTRKGDPVEVIANTNGSLLHEDVELKIAHPVTGEDVARGTQGEICTRGWFVMREYYRMPEETRKAFDKDGWFHTGDLGVLDQHGYLKVTGRAKDMFISGGYNVYPAEIENFLFRNPKIVMAAVIGVPDETMGEVGMAYVKLKEGQTATVEEIIRYARDSMANYKVPKYVRFIDDFPVTPMGKVQKFVLRQEAARQSAQCEGAKS